MSYIPNREQAEKHFREAESALVNVWFDLGGYNEGARAAISNAQAWLKEAYKRFADTYGVGPTRPPPRAKRAKARKRAAS